MAMARPRTENPQQVPGFAARRVAAEILEAVLGGKRPLDGELENNAALRSLDERDRGLIRMLVATVLRRLGTLRHLLGGSLDRGFPKEAPRVETALLLGAAQILLLEVPAHAAVDLSVRLVQDDRRAAHYAGLVNAVLRRLAREGKDLLAAARYCRARYAAVADGALEQKLWRGDRARHRHREWAGAAARSDGESRSRGMGKRGSAAACSRRASVRLIAHGPVSGLPGYSEGGWWVQDAAAALPARLFGDMPGCASLIFAPLRAARARSSLMPEPRSPPSTVRHRGLRGCGRISRGSSFRSKPSPPMPLRGSRRPSTPCCSTRHVPRPEPSAAIPTFPGSSRESDLRRSSPCSSGCSTMPPR